MTYFATSILLALTIGIGPVQAQVIEPSPSVEPSTEASSQPTAQPTSNPTIVPTVVPSIVPTNAPTAIPSVLPTSSPAAHTPTPVPTTSSAATSTPHPSATSQQSSSPAIGGITVSSTPSPTAVPTPQPKKDASLSTFIKKIDKTTQPVLKNIQDVAYAAALETPVSALIGTQPTMYYENHRLSISSTRFLLVIGIILLISGYLFLKPHLITRIRAVFKNYRNVFNQIG